MLENMALISSITNEWSQQQHHRNTNNNNNNNNNHNQLLDEKILMAAASNGRVVASEKQQQIIQQEQQQQQQQQQQQALKCPRCDSSNTKFCYYNNYSLSQPRHFCKACKRYWTRGGTLRNVPVGGGCRKNKRVKRPTSSSSSAAIDTPSSSSSAPTSNPNPSSIQSHHMDHHMSSVFYGLQTNPSDHLSYSRFNPRVSNVDTVVSGFDLQPQLSALGLGFSSEFNGFNNPNTLLSSYPMFGSSAASSNSPTMASLLPSSSFQQQQKYFSNGLKDLRGGGTSFHGLGQYQDLQMQGNSAGKEVKMEEAHGGGGGGGGRIDWDLHGQNQTHHDQINSSDPNLYWNGSGFGGAWLDPANIGSSVPSLI